MRCQNGKLLQDLTLTRNVIPSEANLLIWHQGALGDLLLAGPALVAVSRHYGEARFIAVGHPHRWRLLAGTLPLAAAWDGGEAVWAGLFQEHGGFSPLLRERLAGIDLALVFSPKPRLTFLDRLVQAGVGQAVWIPSFPEGGIEPVAQVQGRRLHELGIREALAPFRLQLEPGAGEDTGFSPDDLILAMAPGSGGTAKNWPLTRYYEVARALAWEAGLKVVWLAGPAEEQVLPHIQGLAAAQEQVVWANEPLGRLARLLAQTQVYLGGDSGITHLAAAAGARRVVALFGPTDPRVWAPWGEQVTVLTPPGGAGRNASLAKLSAASVLAEVRRYL
jgi:Glycosyltransferase family 9 (heptosyltransferase)